MEKDAKIKSNMDRLQKSLWVMETLLTESD